ncbi:uncharacterized protein LOC109428593 [Aedes albopictus]|uniref:Glycoside hydrolase family 19 catalytic domain-containing protein n=1 Tax=Aedes albopictus TaxID=7160 RepID=A0ABM1YGV8_AEDAL
MALHACGYRSISTDDAKEIVLQINKMTESVNEAAMFLAHLFHESGGFQHRSESNGPKKSYAPYYGRGYIQITYYYNYRDASKVIYENEQVLLDFPDKVSETVYMSMRVSVWFWRTKVRPAGGPSSNDFYRTTEVINGELEPPGSFLANRRYGLYVDVADVLGVTNKAKS